MIRWHCHSILTIRDCFNVIFFLFSNKLFTPGTFLICFTHQFMEHRGLTEPVALKQENNNTMEYMKKLKKAFRLLPVLILLICLNPDKEPSAQPLNRQWVVFHDGALSGADHANAIIIDTAGYTFVTGQSFQNSLSGSLTTIMYDPDGNEIWIDNYKGVLVNFTNEGEDICSDPFGNIFVTGTTAWNDGDFAILKFNSTGRVWAKPKEPYFTGSGFDFAKEIACDGAGNIYCAASTQSMGGNLQDLYTLKCDNDGNDIWRSSQKDPPGLKLW